MLKKLLTTIIFGQFFVFNSYSFAQDLHTFNDTNTENIINQSISKKNFDIAKNAIVKIEIEDLNTHSKSSLGSGFFIDNKGNLITNYHVISSYVLNPLKYKIVLYFENGLVEDAFVKGFDVVNDLALLSTKNQKSKYFLNYKKQEVIGEKIYSFGYPLNIGFTMAEGTGNDIPKHSFTQKYLFSGSINSGMSGGPVLNSNSEVIGVNVSSFTGLNLSFIIPVIYVEKLYQKSINNFSYASVNEKNSFLSEIQNQYESKFEDWFKSIKQSQDYKTFDYGRKINIPSNLDCWGKTSKKPLKDLKVQNQICAYEDYIFIRNKNKIQLLNIKITKFNQEDFKEAEKYLLNDFEDMIKSSSKLSFLDDEHIDTPKVCSNKNISSPKGNFYVTTCFEENFYLKQVFNVSVLLTDFKNLLNISVETNGVPKKHMKEYMKYVMENLWTSI